MREDEKLFVPKPYAQHSGSGVNLLPSSLNSYQSSPKALRSTNTNENNDYFKNDLIDKNVNANFVEIKKKRKKKTESVGLTVIENKKK